jgi:hypothetical protein
VNIAVGKQQNSRFSNPQRYSYCPSSGIWQTVWPEPVPERVIIDLHSVPDIEREQLTVTVNTDPLGSNAFLEVTALDGGKILGQGDGTPAHDQVALTSS